MTEILNFLCSKSGALFAVGWDEYCMYQCLAWGMFQKAGDFGEVRREWRVLKVGPKCFPRYASKFGFVLLLG